MINSTTTKHKTNLQTNMKYERVQTTTAHLKLTHYGAGIAQLVVLGLAATVSRVRYSSGDIFR